MLRSALVLLMLSSSAVARAELSIEVYPDTVRFDLAQGTLLLDPTTERRDPSQWRFKKTPVRLAAARGEVVAFQMVVAGPDGTHTIDVEGLSDLKVDVFHEIGIDIASPTESAAVTSLGAGLYPDPLVRTSTVNVPVAPGVAVIWVDVFVPRNTSPGDREGTITIGGVTTPIEVRVLDVELPVADVARLGTVNFGSLLEKAQVSKKHMMAWMQLAHAHRVDIEVMRITPTITDGVIDWDGWIKRVAPYVEGRAFTSEFGYEGPREGTPVVRWIIPLTDWWPTNRTERSLPDDPDRWSETLATWESKVEAMGWFGRPNAPEWILFINGLDEPKTVAELESIAAYEGLIDAAQLKDRSHVWFRVDGNFGPDYGGLDAKDVAKKIGGAVDLWNFHGASNTAPIALIDARRETERECAMFYASNSGGEPSIPPLVIDADIVGARAWAWIVYRYDLCGALNWEVDYYKGGCVSNPKCSEGGRMNLDANLIYRGEELGLPAHTPVPSMRLKVLRRGAQDVAIAAALARDEPHVSKRLAAILVPRALGDDVPDVGRGTWTLDPAAYDRARNTMLTRLAGGTSIPTSTIRMDGKATLRPKLWSYLLGLFVVVGVALVWWFVSRGSRSAANRE